MGLEALMQELNRKTQAEVQRIENEGRLEAKRIKDDAKKESAKRMENGQKEADEFVEREKMRIPAARLKAKRIIQDAKYEKVSEALEELSKMLDKASSKKEYEKVLESLIKEGVEGIGAKKPIIQVRKQDLQIAKKYGTAVAIECMGGAIVTSEDGKMRINNTFEAVLEKRRGELEQAAFEEMFGKVKG